MEQVHQKIPKIMELQISRIVTDTAIDKRSSRKTKESKYIADFIKNVNSTHSHLQWPILVNFRNGSYRLLSGMFYIQVYHYMGETAAYCIVYENLNDLDEMRVAYAALMNKPSIGNRFQSFLHLFRLFGNHLGEQEKQAKIAFVMAETDRQVRKYLKIFRKGSKKINEEVIDDKLALGQAIREIDSES